MAAITYAVTAWAVTLLHLRENPGLPPRRLTPHLTLAAVTTVMLVTTLAIRAPRIFALRTGGLTALDPAGVLSQPTAWLWLLGAIAVPLYVLKLRATRPRNACSTGPSAGRSVPPPSAAAPAPAWACWAWYCLPRSPAPPRRGARWPSTG
ncbi:hypothetical protein BH23ACT2_BH23ACT2_23980 [soil metagenome]